MQTEREKAAEPALSERPGLLHNISWLGLASLAVKPFWFLFITAACMRLLGVDEYGLLSAALSLSAIFTAGVDLGMVQYSVREISKDNLLASQYFTNFMTLRLANSVIGWSAAIIAAVLLGYSGAALGAVAFAGIYTFSLNLTEYCRAIYRAFERLRQEAAMLVLEKILVIGGGLAMLVATRSAQWTLAGMGAGMVLTTVANTSWISRRFARLDFSLLSWDFLKGSLATMIPFGLAGLFTIIYFKIDVVMIEALLGEGPTGQYGAAYRILEALYMLPTIISIAAVYPRLARLHGAGDSRGFTSLLSKSMVGLVGVAMLLAISLSVLAPFVIGLLDPNPAFAPAAGALRILVWSFPILCMNTLLYAALVTLNQQKYLAGSLALVVLLNMSLNLLMIPTVGINGAAIATVGSEIVLLAFYIIRYLRHRPSSR